MARTVLVFSGGAPLSALERRVLPEEAIAVIAADSGVHRAHECDRIVTIAVGDFDSVTAAALAQAERQGAAVRRASTMKDETDLELALAAALEFDPDRLVVAGMSDGRLDHQLSSLHACTHQSLAEVDVDLVMNEALISVVRHRRTMTGSVGDLISLVPLGGDVSGVQTNGLRYPLHREQLSAHRSRGMSNVFDAPVVVVTVDAAASGGVLLAMQPLDAESTATRPSV